MVDSEELPMEEGKENDLKALLLAAEALASPLPKPKKGPSHKKMGPPSTKPVAAVAVTNLNGASTGPDKLSLSRIISKEDDEEVTVKSSPGRSPMMPRSPVVTISASSSNESDKDGVATVTTCTEILPRKAKTDAAAFTSSPPKKMSSSSCKRPRQAEPDLFAFTKKRAPQATKDRKLCSSDGCSNISVNSGVCYRHGAKRRLCKAEGCTLVALQKGVCLRHGAKHPRCKAEGCDKQAQNGGVCRKHGAKVKLCNSVGCKNKARKGGVCIKHGATTSL